MNGNVINIIASKSAVGCTHMETEQDKKALIRAHTYAHTHTNTHARTHNRLTALYPGLPGSACTRKVKPIWISLKQDRVSGSGISRTICKSAYCSTKIHPEFYN